MDRKRFLKTLLPLAVAGPLAVSGMQHPPTSHDFGGFPQELFDVQYPAPGSPELARDTQELVTKDKVELDDKWGLDRGAWSVIKHLYPKADIPVVQMSLDHYQTPQYHYELAAELKSLREDWVIEVGWCSLSIHRPCIITPFNSVLSRYSWFRP